MDYTSYDSIRTNNEEDTQHLSFKPSTIHSMDDLRDEMSKIGSNIRTVDTNWQSRVESIQSIGNLISGHILTGNLAEEFINLLYQIRDGICTQITELRSGVTKEISRVLSYLAICIDEHRANHFALKQQIQPFIDYVIPYILKQTKQTILVISHLSNITLRTIMKRIPISKAIIHLIQNTNVHQQKSVCSRVRCMEYLRILIEVQPYHHHYLQALSDGNGNEYLSLITNAVIHCISDPHPSVRLVARQCVWSLNLIYPQRECASFILSKVSSQNAKYVTSEKVQHQLLPPPIGKGHKVELGSGRNRGLISSASTTSIHSSSSSNASKGGMKLTSKPQRPSAMTSNRPKSALPSRKHRLELLKKRKKEMAQRMRKKKDDSDLIIVAQRPQTAHPHLNRSTPIGQPQRISISKPPSNVNLDPVTNVMNVMNGDHDSNDDVEMNGNGNGNGNGNAMKMQNEASTTFSHHQHRTNKMSIMDTATRYSAVNNTPDMATNAIQMNGSKIPFINGTKCTLIPAQRMTVENTNNSHHQQQQQQYAQRGRSLQDILDAVYDSKIEGVEELSKWIRSNHRDCLDTDNLSVILMSLSGLLDSLAMNRGSGTIKEEDVLIDAMVQCLNNLILFGSTSLSMKDLHRLLSKLLRLFIKPHGHQYEQQYSRYSGYFLNLSKALIATQSKTFSLKSVLMALCETILKPKQKLVWCHFLSVYCKQSPSTNCKQKEEEQQQQERGDKEGKDHEEWNKELILYLFNLLKECVMNPLFIEYHALFRSPQCVMIEDVLKYIMSQHTNSYHDMFRSNFDDTMIETLLGMVENPMMTRILQKYHSSTSSGHLSTINHLHLNNNYNAISSISRSQTPRLSMTPITSVHHPMNAMNTINAINGGHSGGSTFTTPMHQSKRYKNIRKQQIESMTTPPLNMYMTTPAPMVQRVRPQTQPPQSTHYQMSCGAPLSQYQNHNEKENEIELVNMNDEQLIEVLLTTNKRFIKSIHDEKSALKYISHRINEKKAIFDRKCPEILLFVIDIMNSDRFALHRNALRILQAMCWFYPNCINQQLKVTLECIVNLFRATAPAESGELALDVITQFCKVAQYEQCIAYLLPIIQRENEQNGGNGRDRKMFAALSIFDRIVVLTPTQWIRGNVDNFAKLLVAAYRYHREPMRSLIYLAIILDGDSSFLEGHHKEQRIVQMMAKEADFADWVKSHRVSR